MADEVREVEAPRRGAPEGRRQLVNVAIALMAGMVLGAIIVALGFYQPTRRELAAAQDRIGDYADSTATARVAADSLRAELATVAIVAADRDSFQTWYNEAVEMLSQGQVPAATAAAETPTTAAEDWESLGR